MKYVVSWKTRANASEGDQARSLQVFGKWSPAEGTNFVQFLHTYAERNAKAEMERR